MTILAKESERTELSFLVMFVMWGFHLRSLEVCSGIGEEIECRQQPLEHICMITSSSSHLFLNHKGCWCTTDDFATIFHHFSMFCTALWDLPNSRPVHSLMLPSHLFLCLPCLLPPFTVPCKMVLARPDERKTCQCLFTMVRRSSCGPIACWIFARTSLLVTWSLYKMCGILH